MLHIVVAFALVSAPQQPQEPLHKAFVKSPSSFSKAWEKGEMDARAKLDLDKATNRLRRSIGSIRTSPLASEDVSFVWVLPIELMAYYRGYVAAKEYHSDEEVAKVKIMPTENVSVTSLLFYGNIVLMPSFGGGYGRIDRMASPKDLENVRVVLQVGKRILQPLSHPGNMLQVANSAINQFSVPEYEYHTSRADATGSAVGSGGWASGTATSRTKSVSQYTVHKEEGYDWYQGVFLVEIPIVDKDGKPLITSKDKDLELIVVYGNNERRAKYSLDFLADPFK